MVSLKNFSAPLSKQQSTRPEEIFEGRHSPVKIQTFMILLRFFAKVFRHACENGINV